MNNIADPIFQSLFNSDVPRIILKANAPHFTIIDYNTAYQNILDTTKNYREQSIWDIFSSSLADIDGKKHLLTVVEETIAKNKICKTEIFRYDLEKKNSTQNIEQWWQLEIMPIVLQSKVEYLLITADNVTQSVFAKYREQKLERELISKNSELAAANSELISTVDKLRTAHERLEILNHELEDRITDRVAALKANERSLRTLVMTAHYPLMILRGRDWIIEIANQQLVNLWDKTLEDVLGKKLMDVLPELESQPFPSLLRQVYDSGVGYGQEEEVLYYSTPKGLVTKHISFHYDPMFDEEQQVCGIIVVADDITSKVKQRRLMEESLEKEKALADQFTLLNEKLVTTIEELSATNMELIQSQKILQKKNAELAISERRFRNLVRQAPVGICVIRAKDIIVQEINESFIELVGRPREKLEGMLLWEAIPEASEIYAPIVNRVIASGQSFSATEHQVTLIRHGKPDSIFVDVVYEPILNTEEEVVGVMIVAIDVTAKVTTRRVIEDVEERIRLAVQAADIGTFEYNYPLDTLITSERFDDIFGIHKPQSINEILTCLHPEDQFIREKAHEEAQNSGKLFYEARIVHPVNGIKWIRKQANVYYKKNGTPEKLLGTVLDITDFKQLQQQKDDFISIASHELKTPLTSLKVSLQLLQRMKDNLSSPIVPRLIEQSGQSMDKISLLVDDLLNVSRMNEGFVQLKKSNFLVKDLLESCCGYIRENRDQKLIFKGDDQLAVFADEQRVEQVVTNFVNNAIKYAPKSKIIYLVAEKQGNAAKISVKDNGPGIALDKQEHLFDRYYRANNSGKHVSGLGLGLYICADIIHRHGGEIGVSSKLGEGSTFWFTLPLDEVSDKSKHITPSDRNYLVE